MSERAKQGGTLARPTVWIAELAQLNLLTVICCLPIVTAGASLTAMHAVLSALVRKEDGYISRMFFAAFRANLKKATLLWLPFLLIFTAAAADILIVSIDRSLLPAWMPVAAAVVAILSFFIVQFVFPLQARFENSFRGTLSAAMLLSAAHFPKTFVMAVLGIVPLVFGMVFLPALPLALFFGLAAPGYAAAKLYNPIFRKLEENVN